MRPSGLTLAAALLLAPLAVAQPPAGGGGSPIIPVPGSGNNNPVRPAGNVGGGQGNLVPPLDPQTNPLDRHLLNWEARMKSVESIWAKCDRYETDKTGVKKALKGEARYLRPNLAALQMVRTDNPNIYEMYICTGQFFYEYRPQTKEIWVRRLDPQEVQFQNNFLSFLFGMSAVDAKRRYDLKVSKSDENYIHLEIRPRVQQDQREFVRAELVLMTRTLLPRRLWFEHVNGSEVTWDVTSMDVETKLKPTDFTAPTPKDWKMKEMPKEPAAPPPPTKIRP